MKERTEQKVRGREGERGHSERNRIEREREREKNGD